MHNTDVKKFYIAGSFRYVSLINNLSASLEDLNFTRTYDWAKNKEVDTFRKLQSIANKEYKGISDCDFLIFVFPGGKGANIEFGIATALKKRIYVLDLIDKIHDVKKTCTFYYLDNVCRFDGKIGEFPEFIANQELRHK
ncbi:group-specific protein [Lactobacillus sp. UCMA15818]|uniref:group-specific protein n=1 Tax=Lactobacillus sp. UCMA15818 TaxID=2583394 RepID=UPI0025AF2CBC|nr:group-specific protein [Lactobacillus sp. UCMA15818]MDN2452127.1 group-specific protein [Lactobacillus sp. UCMA15818]